MHAARLYVSAFELLPDLSCQPIQKDPTEGDRASQRLSNDTNKVDSAWRRAECSTHGAIRMTWQPALGDSLRSRRVSTALIKLTGLVPNRQTPFFHTGRTA